MLKMSIEKEFYYGMRIKLMCKTEAQYKQALKEMIKIGKCSWTTPIRTDVGEWMGFVNFKGSSMYFERYEIYEVK
jgi:hypothetical protein